MIRRYDKDILVADKVDRERNFPVNCSKKILLTL